MKPIELFLRKVKQLLKGKKYTFLDNRDKNIETLLLLGWKSQHVVDFIINELNPTDIFNGPVDIYDHKLPKGFAYEFLKDIEVEINEVLEKLKLFIRLELTDSDNQTVIIISFHVSER